MTHDSQEKLDMLQFVGKQSHNLQLPVGTPLHLGLITALRGMASSYHLASTPNAFKQ